MTLKTEVGLKNNDAHDKEAIMIRKREYNERAYTRIYPQCGPIGRGDRAYTRSVDQIGQGERAYTFSVDQSDKGRGHIPAVWTKSDEGRGHIPAVWTKLDEGRGHVPAVWTYRTRGEGMYLQCGPIGRGERAYVLSLSPASTNPPQVPDA
eukprot:9468607-Pyramimonas_sp.AAC.1